MRWTNSSQGIISSDWLEYIFHRSPHADLFFFLKRKFRKLASIPHTFNLIRATCSNSCLQRENFFSFSIGCVYLKTENGSFSNSFLTEKILLISCFVFGLKPQDIKCQCKFYFLCICDLGNIVLKVHILYCVSPLIRKSIFPQVSEGMPSFMTTL